MITAQLKKNEAQVTRLADAFGSEVMYDTTYEYDAHFPDSAIGSMSIDYMVTVDADRKEYLHVVTDVRGNIKDTDSVLDKSNSFETSENAISYIIGDECIGPYDGNLPSAISCIRTGLLERIWQCDADNENNLGDDLEHDAEYYTASFEHLNKIAFILERN